jgi:hypothetical protein
MKGANMIQLEMPLDELLAYALNIEEAVVNPGNYNEVNPNNSNIEKTKTTAKKRREVAMANSRKVLINQSLRVKQDLLVIFVKKWPYRSYVPY